MHTYIHTYIHTYSISIHTVYPYILCMYDNSLWTSRNYNTNKQIKRAMAAPGDITQVVTRAVPTCLQTINSSRALSGKTESAKRRVSIREWPKLGMVYQYM